MLDPIPMKYNTLNSILAAAIVLVILATGCKKEDVTAPVITLPGSNPLSHHYITSFTDPGATATDDVDGDISSKIVTSGTVNINALGDNTITYTVSDAAGNSATATRTVNVPISRNAVLGNYSSTNTCTNYPYNSVSSAPAFVYGTETNKFRITPFYIATGTLICTISGYSVTVDPGQAPGDILDGVTGSGTFNAAGKVLTMTYTFTPNGGSPTTCTVTYTRS